MSGLLNYFFGYVVQDPEGFVYESSMAETARGCRERFLEFIAETRAAAGIGGEPIDWESLRLHGWKVIPLAGAEFVPGLGFQLDNGRVLECRYNLTPLRRLAREIEEVA